MGIEMTKIPVKIVQVTSPSGKKKNGVMLDLYDYKETKGNPEEKLRHFEKLYFKTVNKAQNLFYGKGVPRKKYQNLPSSLYWELGNILCKFNEQIKNEFLITNYAQALFRDFGLSKDYVYDLLTIAKLFKENEIIDEVPFSYYRALKRKSKELQKYGIFKKEVMRLNKVGKEGKLVGRENYKSELNKIIEKFAQSHT